MKVTYSASQLIDFETEVANLFNTGKIRAPIHLYDGNEEQIIKIFEDINADDWIFCSWRSHYQCLLKGVPQQRVVDDILDGKSISLCYPDFNLYSSAIVGGQVPIATGAALKLKRASSSQHVWCFVGDMTSETGIFYESWKYAVNHDLPITFVIENNHKSVCTDTDKAWGHKELFFRNEKRKIKYYEYASKYPHAGAGVRVNF